MYLDCCVNNFSSFCWCLVTSYAAPARNLTKMLHVTKSVDAMYTVFKMQTCNYKTLNCKMLPVASICSDKPTKPFHDQMSNSLI
jgi:hypothetical protein